MIINSNQLECIFLNKCVCLNVSISNVYSLRVSKMCFQLNWTSKLNVVTFHADIFALLRHDKVSACQK